MSQAVVPRASKSDLEILKKARVLKGFYLAGGTGLALQLQHRLSLDLDFFTKKEINVPGLIQALKGLGDLSVTKEATNTLTGHFNKTRFTFLKYDYPLLFPLKKFEGIGLASVQDIASMKLSAVSSRGAKKDFIDLFFVCREVVPLEQLLRLFQRKYRDVDYNLMHVLKSLVYFQEAEKEPMPKMLKPIKWREVKEFFKAEVRGLNR